MGDSNSQRNENRFRSALTSPKLDGVELERMNAVRAYAGLLLALRIRPQMEEQSCA